MATYATYRHIELDKVGYSKKRVRNVPSSDIVKVISTPEQNGTASMNSSSGSSTPRRRLSSNDSFNRLFGKTPVVTTPRRASLTKHDVTNRNPVTGDGVQSWDTKGNRNTPKVRKERNPVTGETYTIVSPATTPTKVMTNGHPKLPNGNTELPIGPTTNGQA